MQELRGMPVVKQIAADAALQQLVCQIKTAPGHLSIRIEIQRKYIDVYAMIHFPVSNAGFDEGGLAVPKLGKITGPSRIRAIGLQEAMSGHVFSCDGEEPFIIPAGHAQVDIIIPGDVSFVADCAQQGPAQNVVLKV